MNIETGKKFNKANMPVTKAKTFFWWYSLEARIKPQAAKGVISIEIARIPKPDQSPWFQEGTYEETNSQNKSA